MKPRVMNGKFGIRHYAGEVSVLFIFISIEIAFEYAKNNRKPPPPLGNIYCYPIVQ